MALFWSKGHITECAKTSMFKTQPYVQNTAFCFLGISTYFSSKKKNTSNPTTSQSKPFFHTFSFILLYHKASGLID